MNVGHGSNACVWKLGVRRGLVLTLVALAAVALGGAARTASGSTMSSQSQSIAALDPEPLERSRRRPLALISADVARS